MRSICKHRFLVGSLFVVSFITTEAQAQHYGNCGFIRGDADFNWAIGQQDANIVITCTNNPNDPICPARKDVMDADDNGQVNSADAVYLLNYLYMGGPEPPHPFHEICFDPTPDALGSCCDFEHKTHGEPGFVDAGIAELHPIQSSITYGPPRPLGGVTTAWPTLNPWSSTAFPYTGLAKVESGPPVCESLPPAGNRYYSNTSDFVFTFGPNGPQFTDAMLSDATNLALNPNWNDFALRFSATISFGCRIFSAGAPNVRNSHLGDGLR